MAGERSLLFMGAAFYDELKLPLRVQVHKQRECTPNCIYDSTYTACLGTWTFRFPVFLPSGPGTCFLPDESTACVLPGRSSVGLLAKRRCQKQRGTTLKSPNHKLYCVHLDRHAPSRHGLGKLRLSCLRHVGYPAFLSLSQHPTVFSCIADSRIMQQRLVENRSCPFKALPTG